MITESEGNLLKAPVEALVNTVNTEGVMGKGIALQFKNSFPDMFKDYARAAKRGQIVLGRMSVWPTQALAGPQYVINFPTKGHWRAKSRIADIDSGLRDLIRIVRELEIKSIAVPPLGCGNGGLNWLDVAPLIRAAFNELPEVDVRLYPPAGTPVAADMTINTEMPAMSPGRAALVGLIARYTQQALNAPSLIETQKLMYFLQFAGEPLKLNFRASHYGPYADNLRHVLEKVEGHFLTGYGDGTAKVLDAVPLKPVAGAVATSEAFLSDHPETTVRMAEVLKLAEGFESAYGMELLATVHWVVQQSATDTPDEVIASKVAAWSPRKARMFTPHHVDSALRALRSADWLLAA